MRPILFKLFGFPIHSYGVMIVIAFLVGVWIVRRRAPRYGLDPQKLTDALIAALIFGILGARVAYILQELPYYRLHPGELFSIQMAGITSFGGIAAGAISLIVWAKRRKVSPMAVFDCVGPTFLVANAIGRVGCLLNGCCYGGICADTLPWKIHVPDAPGWHHPAQMYDSLMNLIAFGAILAIEHRRRWTGQGFALAMIGYGLSRFIYEFWRAGSDADVSAGIATSTYWIGKVTQAQAAALVMVAVGAVVFVVGAARKRADNVDLGTGADVVPA